MPLPPSWEIHWLVWLITLGLDAAVFGGNLSMLAGYLILLIVAVPFFFGTFLIQQHMMGDSKQVAAGKAFLLLALVAIPTPIASIVGAAGAVLAPLLKRGRE